MRPVRIPIKGPQGKDDESGILKHGAEFQEMDESDGKRVYSVPTGFVQDPTELKASDEDHTPNHTKGPKPSKPEYGRFYGRGNGGVGL